MLVEVPQIRPDPGCDRWVRRRSAEAAYLVHAAGRSHHGAGRVDDLRLEDELGLPVREGLAGDPLPVLGRQLGPSPYVAQCWAQEPDLHGLHQRDEPGQLTLEVEGRPGD